MNDPIESTDWHYSPGAKRTETDDSTVSHGTCVASKAAGAIYGVAKDARLIILKATLSLADIWWALLRARDDIRLHNRQMKSVVLLAALARVPYYPGQDLEQPWYSVKRLMQELIESDAVIVVPAGNEAGRNKNVDLLPALWESRTFPIIVAGTIDDDGVTADFSQGPDHVTAYAPGDPVRCAIGNGYTSHLERGTSFSAGMVSVSASFVDYVDRSLTRVGKVAGLVAYFLGLDKVPFEIGQRRTAANVRDFIQSKASWQRIYTGPKYVIWNLEDGLA